MKAYFYLVKIRMQLSLVYRFEFITSIFVQIIVLFANSFLWRVLYINKTTVVGVNINQMLTYSIMSVLISCIFYYEVENELRSRIRHGDIAIDFLKPVNIFAMYFCNDIGNALNAIIQRVLPLLLIAALFIQFPLPASPIHLLLFVISTAFSFLILWFLGAIFGMINFWVINLGPLGNIKHIIIRLLSGSIIPVWFFPAWIQKLFSFFPFIYTYQQPLGIYVGKFTMEETLSGMGIQLAWVLILYGSYSIMKNRALKNVLIQGG
jgi:ABC-2 type transport system permease protein